MSWAEASDVVTGLVEATRWAARDRAVPPARLAAVRAALALLKQADPHALASVIGEDHIVPALEAAGHVLDARAEREPTNPRATIFEMG